MPFQIVRNDLTKMEVDAIVNTANPHPVFGSGLDTAVYEAAGTYNLLLKRQEIGEVERGCSFITDGYKLPAKYIIHTVGTKWIDGESGEEEIIRNCYRSAFKLAQENDIESLAFPLLASGNYKFPKKIALRIAISEIEEFLKQTEMNLYLVVFDDESYSVSKEFYSDIDSYISSKYVEEAEEAEYPEREELRGSSSVLSHSVFRKSTESIPSLKKDKKAEKESRSLDDLINDIDKTFMEMVFSFADEKGFTDVEVQKKANLDRKAFSKLKCGTTKKPSKGTALALAIALELNLDETKDLLARAGYALSPCDKQDIIVQYFIEREAYDIYEVNFALFEHDQPELGAKV